MRASLYLILVVYMFICAFLDGSISNATVVLQRNAISIKKCRPFTCLLGDLDEVCEIRTKKKTSRTTCRHMMRYVCNKVEENDREFLNECHKGINKEGKKCTKCEAASKMCRTVFDTLPVDVRAVSVTVPNTLENISRPFRERFIFRGLGYCNSCTRDNRDNWDW